jgi:hypothetical protein
MIDKINVSAQEVVSRHHMKVVRGDAKVLNVVAGSGRTDPHGAPERHPQVGLIGQGLERGPAVLSKIPSKLLVRSHIGAPAAGGPVYPENDSAVILKPRGKEFGGAIAEGIGDDDRRTRVLPTNAVAGYRIGVGKAGRKGRSCFHRAFDGLDPGGQSGRTKVLVGLLQPA